MGVRVTRGVVACAIAMGAVHGLSDSAAAADAAIPAFKAPAYPSPFDWNGFYFGGHVGYARGATDATVTDGSRTRAGFLFGSQYGGIQGGYNIVLPSRLMLGIEGDATFANFLDQDAVVWTGLTARSTVTENIDFISTVRGRVGYVFDKYLVYGTGGFAWSSSHVTRAPFGQDEEFVRPGLRTGWVAGAGVEYGFESEWSLRLEYLYSRFGGLGVTFPFGAQYASTLDHHVVRLGLNYHIGKSAAQKKDGDTPDVAANWEIHGQTTVVYQGYPGFRALYTGVNSLTPGAQSKETWSNSAFLAVRLWDGAELYYNPELLQGFGLSSTVGAGGFPNGEAQKSDFLYPRYNTSRLFLRQTFGFGGEQETVESEQNQMGGKRDISRLTVQVGKFSVKDVFDNNTYSSDPRVHFLNWSIWAAGAFDYPADKVGLTWGAAAELNQKNWAFRAGYFLVGNEPNSNTFDPAVFRRGGYLGEFETRYNVLSRPGKLRIGGWFTNTFAGSYRGAVDLVALDPTLDPNTAIALTRQSRVKVGYYVNVEQAVTDDIGVFGRWSWNNGTSEISAFTDIDASLSVGVSIKGTAWGRPADTIGLAGVVNALSKDQRDYTAIGGLGILIGDGRLNYREEKIIEAYYGLSLAKDITFTLDYQFFQNPAYNADRGPIHVFTGRLHGEF